MGTSLSGPRRSRANHSRLGPIRRLVYPLLLGGTRLLFRWYFRLRVQGLPEPFPGGPLVVAANHCSYLDPVLLSVSLPRPVVYLVTSDVYYLPWMRPFMWLFGCIPVEENAHNLAAIRAALQELRAGHVIGIFPEGGISDDGRLRPGQKGVAALLLKGQAPILPATLVGPYKALPRGRRFPRRAPLITRFAPLILPDVVDGEPSPARARERILEGVMEAIQSQLPETQHPAADSPLVR